MCETRGELIELANTNGYEVSAAQLQRWRQRGLLPRPQQEHLGKGRGTRTVYPEGTGQQLLALCAIHLGEGVRRLEWVAWRLWWPGGEISMEPVRALLAREAVGLDRMWPRWWTRWREGSRRPL